MTIAQRISNARTNLLLDHPWFGSLSMNLKIVPCDSIPTFGVDGTSMFYNPTYADTKTDKELCGILAHEVMHCALLHIYRRNGRDPMLWNIAADYAINQELINSGLTLPKGCLLDSKYKDLPAETIYAQLKKQVIQLGGKLGIQGDGQPTGTFSDAPSDGQGDKSEDGEQSPKGQPNASNGQQKQPSKGGMSEQDWKIAAEQATKVAKAAGKLSGDIDRMIQESRKSKTDWRQELREFLEQTTPSDYSWQSPNRRYIHAGIYLPGMIKEGFGKLVLACDTSGSISQEDLNVFAAEVSAIASDLKPESIDVLYCDAAVKGIQQFMCDEDIKLQPKGGGGTCFQPVFDYVAEHYDEPPKALLYYSADLWNSDHPIEPTDYPTLWITGMHVTRPHPFGKVIKLEV